MLIKEEKLNKVLQSFYTLTGVRIAIYDEWYREICSYPRSMCGLCLSLRRYPSFDTECRSSDENAFRIAEGTRRQYTYKCHAGLYESVYPIISEGSVLGFLMIGQFITESERSGLESGIRGSYPNAVPVRDDLEAITVLSPKKAEAIAEIMSVCAEYLCFSKAVSARRMGLSLRAERYVEENLGKPISVDGVAKALGVSRTTAYVLFKKSFGKSITEYVNYRRIEKAKSLIVSGATTAEILESLGLDDANYFYRLFRKIAGVTLAEYRKEAERRKYLN